MAESEPSAFAWPAPRENPHLVGHEAAAALAAAWRSGRLAHAWLIAGPRGIGKATLAYRFARFALSGGEPGGEGRDGAAGDALAMPPDHPVFRRVAAGGHSDLAVIERGLGERGRLRAEIVVDDVRKANAFLSLTAGEGGWRVVVVDAAEEMNRNAANALLKRLEEPPGRVLFLLVSHAPSRLPATLRSRCRVLTLAPLPAPALEGLLAEAMPGLPADERRVLGLLAEGSPGRARGAGGAGRGRSLSARDRARRHAARARRQAAAPACRRARGPGRGGSPAHARRADPLVARPLDSRRSSGRARLDGRGGARREGERSHAGWSGA